MHSVLIVDDEKIIRLALARIFKKIGCETFEADSIENGLKFLTSKHCDVVFCDLRFPGDVSGVKLLESISEQNIKTKVVMMSCAMEEETISYLSSMGAAKCLKKPFFQAECREVLNSLFSSSCVVG